MRVGQYHSPWEVVRNSTDNIMSRCLLVRVSSFFFSFFLPLSTSLARGKRSERKEEGAYDTIHYRDGWQECALPPGPHSEAFE